MTVNELEILVAYDVTVSSTDGTINKGGYHLVFRKPDAELWKREWFFDRGGMEPAGNK